MPPCQHLVQQRTDLIDIGPPIHSLPTYLLRRHVQQRSWLEACPRHRVAPHRLGHVRDPKVADLGPSILGEQHVLRLHVPVDDAFGVGRRQPLAHLCRDAHCLLHWQRAAFFQQRAQAATGEVLHHQIDIGLHDLESIDGDDMRMIQAASGAGLLDETPEGHLVGLGGEGQFLDGDRAVEKRVVGQVDGPEGTSAQHAHDVVFK